jgi:hypothetical protein
VTILPGSNVLGSNSMPIGGKFSRDLILIRNLDRVLAGQHMQIGGANQQLLELY